MAFTISSLVWLILLIAFVVVEALTVSLVSIWFAAGAVAALIVSGFTSSWLVQFAVFAVVSAVALAATRPLVKKRMTARRVPTNADINVAARHRFSLRSRPTLRAVYGWTAWTGTPAANKPFPRAPCAWC